MEKKITLETLSNDIDRLAKNTFESMEKLARMTQAGFLDMQSRMATKEDVARLETRVEHLEKRVGEWGQRTSELEARMDIFDRSMENLRKQMENGFRDMVIESREIRKMFGVNDQRKEILGLKTRVKTIEEKLGIEQ